MKNYTVKTWNYNQPSKVERFETLDVALVRALEVPEDLKVAISINTKAGSYCLIGNSTIRGLAKAHRGESNINLN